MLQVKEINNQWYVMRDGEKLHKAGINYKSEAVSIAEGMDGEVEVIEEDTNVMEEIKNTFGENFIIKNKKVAQQVLDLKCTGISENLHGGIHFATNGTYKAEGETFPLYFYAEKMKNGKWWVR